MTELIFLLDESRSMDNHLDIYLNCLNSLVNTQKILNPTLEFTLIKFNNKIECLCNEWDITDIPNFTREHYHPNGGTSLIDTIGLVLQEKINKKHVILIILTDGEDNASHKFNQTSVKSMIKSLSNWEFLYIATSPEASEFGNVCLGIDKGVTYNETKNSLDNVVEVCNIVIGQSIYKWHGVYTEYIQYSIPTDVRDIMNGLENFKME